MSPQTLARYGTLRVPRYTSYPTAPHFTAAVGPDTYCDWLDGIDPDAPVSLYLHVPFCHEICWYCGCNMKLAKTPEPVAEYASMLRREVAQLADRLPARMRVSHLHWGGGTPTALHPDDLERVMDDIRARFDVTASAEIAIECDPRTLSEAMIATIGSLGFNRASFGVQEFDLRVQKAINRIQPPAMVRRAVEMLRAAGVSGVNFDLIYGLPHQTADTLLRTIRTVTQIGPERVALFGYAHVPWVSKRQRMIDQAMLPGAKARAEQASVAAQALEEAGYIPVGIDHFALPNDALGKAHAAGRVRRNFQGYTTDASGTLLGLGASSISRTPKGYAQNVSETRAWARAVAAGQPPIVRGHVFQGDDLLRWHVIEKLMCEGEVDLKLAARDYGAPEVWYGGAAGALTDFVREGLIEFSNGRIRITEAGFPLTRVVASAFDSYLNSTSAKHAVAI